MLTKDSRVLIAGAGCMVGAALSRRFREIGFPFLFTDLHPERDFRDFSEAKAAFEETKPAAVILIGGRSAGIEGNLKYPAELVRDNLFLASNVIHLAWQSGVKKLLFLASSCCYPRECPQPIREESLLTGALEPTNEAYALAKLAGWGMAKAYALQYGVSFITAIPSNPFGPGDDFNPKTSHVAAALIRKVHEAKVRGEKTVTLWGTGKAVRDFIYVDDVADACIHLLEHYDSPEPVNIGSKSVLTIRELAERIMEVVGLDGEILLDPDFPDGMPSKVLDTAKINKLGWSPKTDLKRGIALTYEWFLQRKEP